jgi:hypothetical protein
MKGGKRAGESPAADELYQNDYDKKIKYIGDLRYHFFSSLGWGDTEFTSYFYHCLADCTSP